MRIKRFDSCVTIYGDEMGTTLRTDQNKQLPEMTLALEDTGKSSFLADETPTPTILIRNCEEVGLFEDLNHVNPFEETFRRAVEEKSAGESSSGEGTPISQRKKPKIDLRGFLTNHNEDTLHTPHIFPHLDPVETPKKDEIVPKPEEKTKIESVSKSSKRGRTIKQKLSRLVPKPPSMATPSYIIVNYQDQLNQSAIQSQTVDAKQRLKNAILKNMNREKHVNINNCVVSVPSPQKPVQIIRFSSAPPPMKPKSVAVERNNLAAQRYRSRMKQYYEQLEDRNKNLERENESLRQENAALRRQLTSTINPINNLNDLQQQGSSS